MILERMNLIAMDKGRQETAVATGEVVGTFNGGKESFENSRSICHILSD